MKKLLQFALFLGFGVGVMALLFRSQNAAFQEQCRLDGTPLDRCSLIDKLLNDYASASPGWLLAVVVAFTLSNAFRARRWQMLLAPTGHPVRFANSFLTILLGYFVNLGFPRAGELARAGALARYERAPLDKVVGTLVVDRLMDFLCLGLVVGLAFLFEGNVLLEFIQNRQQTNGGSGGGLLSNPLVISVLLIGGAVLVAAFLFRKRLSTLGPVQKILLMVDGFRSGLRSVWQLEKPGWFIAYSLGIWLMFYLQCYFNLQAFAPTAHLTLGAALMVFVFGTLGFVIPSPGGMGTYHALCIASLALYGIASADAFSYANIAFFTVQIFYNLVGGVAALVLLPVVNRRRER